MKGRLVLANGLILSKIIYMITIWGGTHEIHLSKIQKLLNRTARYVIQGGWRMKSIKLMEKCKWLTAKELVTYHSMITLWKLLNCQKPKQLAEKFKWIEDRNIETSIARLQNTESNFRWRSIDSWNALNDKLRYSTKISQFKLDLKKTLISRRNN